MFQLGRDGFSTEMYQFRVANGFQYHPAIISQKDRYAGSLKPLSQKPEIENAPDLPPAGTDVAFVGPLI